MTPTPVDFQRLQLPKTSNYYLMSPPRFCNVAASQTSPIFKLPVQQVIAAWQTIIKQQPRTALLQSNVETQKYFYVQRSFIFRFPEYITVQFIALDEQTSTLAIYSHALYGYSDFGVNKKRVLDWLGDLQANLTNAY